MAKASDVSESTVGRIPLAESGEPALFRWHYKLEETSVP
jgi:hypothetical protein